MHLSSPHQPKITLDIPPIVCIIKNMKCKDCNGTNIIDGICQPCDAQINEDAWIDEALHSYAEGYGEWDAWQAQYDVADMDIYY